MFGKKSKDNPSIKTCHICNNSIDITSYSSYECNTCEKYVHKHCYDMITSQCTNCLNELKKYY